MILYDSDNIDYDDVDINSEIGVAFHDKLSYKRPKSSIKSYT